MSNFPSFFQSPRAWFIAVVSKWLDASSAVLSSFFRLPHAMLGRIPSDRLEVPSSAPEPLLFQLPSEWFVGLLSEWLDLPSIGMLDTAMTSKSFRPRFLHSLQAMRSTTVDEMSQSEGRLNGGLSAKEMVALRWRWLSIRQVYVENFTLLGKTMRSDFVIPSVRHMHAYTFADEDLYSLIHNCPSLQSISLQSFATNLVTPMGLRSLSRLHLTLEVFVYDRSATFPDEYYTQTAAALVDVFRQCTSLRRVVLVGTTLRCADLDAFCAHGHLFHHLQFCRDGRESATVARFLAHCSHLTTLHYRESAEDDPHSDDSHAMSTIHQSCLMLEDLALRECLLPLWLIQNIATMSALKQLTIRGGLVRDGFAVLGTMKITHLSVTADKNDETWTEDVLQSLFVGSSLCQTIESFTIEDCYSTEPIDDIQVALALATCPHLQSLSINFARTTCLFGQHGLTGFQAMAAGCPLLSEVVLHTTVEGIPCLGTQFPKLKSCAIIDHYRPNGAAPEGFPSIVELQTLYPAVQWEYRIIPRG